MSSIEPCLVPVLSSCASNATQLMPTQLCWKVCCLTNSQLIPACQWLEYISRATRADLGVLLAGQVELPLVLGHLGNAPQQGLPLRCGGSRFVGGHGLSHGLQGQAGGLSEASWTIILGSGGYASKGLSRQGRPQRAATAGQFGRSHMLRHVTLVLDFHTW